MKKTILLLALIFSVVNSFSQVTLSVSETSIAENGSATLTATIDVAKDVDVTIPLSFSGNISLNKDFNTEFEGKGEKSLVYDIGNNSYGDMAILPDEKIVFLKDHELRIYDPVTDILEEKTNLNYYYESGNSTNLIVKNETTLYARSNQGDIVEIDISDLDNITETIYLNSGNDAYVENFSFTDNNLYYSLYNNAINRRSIFKKSEDQDSEMIHITDGSYYQIFELSNKIYAFEYWDAFELINGERVQINTPNNSQIRRESITIFNNELYGLVRLNGQNNYTLQKINIEGNQLTFESLPINNEETINFFSFNPVNGNLITSESKYENNNTNYSINSYQLAPQLKILAGETSGEFTLVGIDDELFELTETLIVTAGTPTNATIADGTNTTFSVAFTDNDEAPEVTFEFSAEAIEENATENVNLIATLDAVSGVDVTIPFTLSGTANLTAEYVIVDDATEITIPAGQTSGSIAISTNGLDDDQVEIIETIVFTFGDITNGSTETSEVTLNLLSNDDPEINSIVANITTAEENGEFVITATSSAASAKDINIPLTFSGDAKLGLDFTSEFEGKGEKSLVYDIGNNSYGDMAILPDEKIVFLKDHELRIYDPVTDILEEKTNLNYYYESGNSTNLIVKNETTLYARSNQGDIVEIDISDLDNITETIYLNSGNDAYVENFSFTDNNLYYSLYNNAITRRSIFKKSEDQDSEMIHITDGSYYQIFELNNKIYAFEYWDAYELINGERVQINKPDNSQIRRESLIVFNNELYGLVRLNGQNNYTLQKITIEGNQLTFEILPVSIEETINFFSFNPVNGNLITSESKFENNNTNYSINSYQLTPELKILAGETSGEVTLIGVDDQLDEIDENIIINFLNPIHASYASSLLNDDQETTPITLTITDNDDLAEVTFKFSSENIRENSEDDVTLTAQLSQPSGKEVIINFELEGTAILNTDYTISNQSITIPAGELEGFLTISTSTIPADGLVEILDTIVFKVSDITNATAPIETATLYLESNESPNVSISVSKDTIAEHQTFNLIATLDAPTSKEVSVGIESLGSAEYNLDFIRNSAIEVKTVAGGNGYGSDNNQIARPNGIFIDSSGNIYITDAANGRIQKWAPDSKEGQTVITDSWDPRDVYVDIDKNIYYLDGDGRSVWKIAEGETDINNRENVAGTGYNGGQALNQLERAQSFIVDERNNIYVADSGNNRIVKWAPDATEGEIVAGGNGYGNANNQLAEPRSVGIDLDGNFLIVDSNNRRIQKWIPNATEGETLINFEDNTYNNNGNTYPLDLKIDSKGNIYVLVDYYDYNLNRNINKVFRYQNGSNQPVTIIGETAEDSDSIQLAGVQNFNLDNLGNVYISDIQNRRILKYEYSLQVKVKPGETEGTLSIAGVEDELNEEGTEIITLKSTQATNGILQEVYELNVNLLDNTKNLTLKESPFLGLSEGAVSWGDYDKDGDQDVAVMGKSGSLGAVTKLYNNDNGVFLDTQQNLINLYGGDITWVDINKDGYIDIVVSGYDGIAREPVTKVYLNEFFGSQNIFTEPQEGFELPQLFSTKMAWGDLDNDGDIDLAIAGQDANNEYVFEIYYKDDNSNNFIKDPDFYEQGFINGDLKIIDVDLDGDNDIIYNGENSNQNPVGGIIFNSYINKDNNNNYYDSGELQIKNSAIEVAKLFNWDTNINIISSGENSQGEIKLYGLYGNFPALRNGDITVADYDNDGKNDILFTGEDELGIPTTKLFKQTSTDSNFAQETTFKDSGIELKGLRASTANWVDYDMDGDLDLFLTGIGDAGSETLLYESEIANKKNEAPEKITGLNVVDLGNGNVRFEWDLPEDDYSTNLGYVLRLGTTEGGTELSNTESDLDTGDRLISKAPPIYTNFYETQLDPGNYYWSVQAVDTGLKGGAFSEEDSFQLLYEWKILNQGGIVNRVINGADDPVIKLADIDNDNDLDVIFSSKNGGNTRLLKYDGTKLVSDSENPLSNLYSNVTNTEVSDVNGDGIVDILVNTINNPNANLSIYLSNATNSDGTGNMNIISYNEVNIGEGLFNAKARIVDLNNDGQSEIFLVGMSSNSINAEPKLYVYEYNENDSFSFKDISNQIAPLQNASYDLGDYDNDQDIDFIISGWSFASGYQSYIYENITELGGDFALNQTSNNLVAVQNGTTNFIDFDGDGDLDAIFSGESRNGDVFEIYINTLTNGIATFSRLPNNLAPMREGKIDLGDFNGDGYADLLYSGTFQGTGDVTKLNEYNPNTKEYVDSAFDVSDIIKAEVEFGDLDGDGDLDFVIAGKSNETDQYGNSNNQNIFRTYLNVRNESALVLENSTSGKRPKYEGKNASRYRQRESFTINNAPTVPVLKDVKFLEDEDNSQEIPVEFAWQASTDDHTPQEGLTYAIKIGTTPGGEEIMSSNANTNGIKKNAEKGNVEHNLKWSLSLPEGTYYYSVQSVDASYSGSQFTEPVQFKITQSGIDSDTDSDGVENSLDLCPNTPAGLAVDSNGCEVDNVILGDANGDSEVKVQDLTVAVNYILGKNPVPFVFKAADVNNDDEIDVIDIVGIVDLILNPTSGKQKINKDSYYSNIPIGDAIFSWEGNDLYVETENAIAGMQLVFDKEFSFQLSDNLKDFNVNAFNRDNKNVLMIYNFKGASIKSGRVKILTKLENSIINLEEKKSATSAEKGLTLNVKFKSNEDEQLESLIIAPNPSDGHINISYNLPSNIDEISIRVFNINGSEVWSSKKVNTIPGNQKTSIDISFLSKGIYFMRIERYNKGNFLKSNVEKLILK